MALIVNWQNATRTLPDRQKVERSYRDRLLELCNSEHHARLLHDIHRQAPSPFSTWAKFNSVAAIEATAGLMPTERKEARFTVRFEV